jgi:hypothetical protein
MSLMTRLILVILVVVTLLGGVMLFTYDIIKLEWVSFMEIQPSYRANGQAPAGGSQFHPD